MTTTERKTLGRGLSALLGDETASDAPTTAPVTALRPGHFQPRKHMDEGALEELATSIAEKGVLQPLLVRADPSREGGYEIVAGERRWRAAQRAGLHDVPILVHELSDQDACEIALVENLQRQDLSPMEEAEGYQRLMREFARTQEELAETVGKSRSHVANTLRLLTLPEAVQAMVRGGEVSAGHARALIGSADPVALARTVAARGLNVRQTERLAKTAGKPGNRKSAAPQKDADTLALERDLSNRLGLAVEIRNARNGGTVVLHYRSLDQLDTILTRLSSRH